MSLPQLLFRLLLGKRLPLASGTLAVHGIDGEVLIRRDGWGVPHISAQSTEDAWYGVGFCQGQDRAFQLDSLARVVRGTLAEVIGPDGLPIDRLSRRIGFVRAAEEQLPLLSESTRRMVEWYAAGINSGVTVGVKRRAHEFALLRSRPSPWRPVDVLGYLKLTSFLLTTNWDVELARLKILTEDGPEALEALDPTYPEWQPVISPPGAMAGPAAHRLADEAASFMEVARRGGGSNNWAVAAHRTATGRPIFANDPHLGSSLPPHWYLAHLTTPEGSMAGATFVGGAGMPVGHNGFAAWGVTVGMTDNTDLFVEEMGPDGRSIRQGDSFVPCEVRSEVIKVKGKPDVIEDVVITPRGPIIGPALDGEVGAVSLRAVWLDPLSLEGLLRLQTVRGFDDFRAALRDWPALPLNVAYADASGTIGWQLIGTAPRRRKGYGAVPLAGWDPGVGWEAGHLPDDQLPYLRDPECGFVATANNKAVRDGDGPFLTVDWLDGYRAARIVEALAERNDWDLEGTARLQMDVTSLPWREMGETVLALSGPDPATRQALDLLRAWDGQVAADSPAAAVFELFTAEMCRRLVLAKAPRSYQWALGRGFHSLLLPYSSFPARRIGHLSRLLREQPPGWFQRGWEIEMAGALGAAIRSLQAGHGEDPARWGWGRIRQLTLTHPFGARKPFQRIFNLGPFPWGGDSNTPGQAGTPLLEPTANPTFIASLRMVVDVGAWENSRFVLPGGQSGNPLSPHYGDQLPLWQRGEGIPIPWSEEAVAAATREALRLVPTR